MLESGLKHLTNIKKKLKEYFGRCGMDRWQQQQQAKATTIIWKCQTANNAEIM